MACDRLFVVQASQLYEMFNLFAFSYEDFQRKTKYLSAQNLDFVKVYCAFFKANDEQFFIWVIPSSPSLHSKNCTEF